MLVLGLGLEDPVLVYIPANIATAIKVARKLAAPRPCLRDTVIRDVFSQQAADATRADTIDWMVRCDWLQVASSRIILHTHNADAASVAVLLASFIKL